MKPQRIRYGKLLFLLLSILLVNGPISADHPAPSPAGLDAATNRYSVNTTKPYDDVVDDLEFAISQNNYRITGRNEIGKAIAEGENITYPRSIIIHFCNLQVAREIFDLNPDFLLHMPCRISLRETQGGVLIEARLVPEVDPALQEVALRINAMMRGIADYAAE